MKLLLDDLWHQCRDVDPGRDGEEVIKKVLSSLPKTLGGTYHKCLTKNNLGDQALGYRVLRYVCDAAIPLSMGVLQNALACNIETGELTSSPVSRAQILRCGANLVIVDKDDNILPAHHSVRQWISGDLNGPPKRLIKDQTDLELGELSVKHYSACFPLEIVTKEFLLTPVPSNIPFGSSTPWWTGKVVRNLLSKGNTSNMGMTSSHTPRSYEFLDYARKSWLHNTRFLPSDSPVYALWRSLAFKNNHRMQFPWGKVGDDRRSHLINLCGWAVTNDHHALLDVFLSSPDVLRQLAKTDLYNEPLPNYNNAPPLIAAAKAGQTRVVLALLTSGLVNADDRDVEQSGIFHTFARGGVLEAFTAERLNNDIVSRLITQLDDNSRTPLYHAAEEGYLDIVRSLLQFGSSAYRADRAGKDPLQAAALRGHLEVVDLLLTAGANVNAPAPELGYTALQGAARRGHVKVVERLLSADADVNIAASDGISGTTALQAAAEGGYLEIVEKLLSANADVNAATGGDDVRTALSAAARGGSLEVVERLLSAGADIKGEGGWEAVRYAAEKGHLEVVERLIKAGAAGGNLKVVKALRRDYSTNGER